jgi:hypothetical protein
MSGMSDFKDEPYVISDERLAEIRALFTEETAPWDSRPATLAPGVTLHALASAVEDLLAERDERTSSCA